ncbi:AAA domain-containing protein [Dehalobacter sp. DCM]|uniref:AAA domain-containing protein n=1 Tax=Dehalobacter sp. DCM TaxID=2907827 RepID=UPI0030818C30|nr:AAA domain-containing protein [Dehalobacter sp. DCM]
MEVTEHNLAKTRILQIFKYLQALNQLRNPVIRDIDLQPWCLWFKDLPDYKTIGRGQFENNDSDTVSNSIEQSNSYVLKVQRPDLTDAPLPPKEYSSILKDSWKKPDQTIHFHLESIALTGEEEEEELTDTKVLHTYLKEPSFEEWYKRREIWVEKEISARKAMSIYNRLFELYARLEKEAEQYEIVLGDGLLSWNHTTGKIHHPILLMGLKLEFDPSVPEFSLLESEQPIEIYTALFRSISEVTGIALNHLQEELEHSQFHPLGAQETEEYLKRVVTQLSPYGQLFEKEERTQTSDTPWIIREPLVFMRKRSLGFSKAIEEIIQDIPENEELPGFLKNVVGIEYEEKPQDFEDTIRTMDPNGEDENILLSKPANAEQLLIADRLNHSSAVLVQGPPGTGKTHTIANLIGHLLAQGKSILVTSHTSKALSVLHEKIVEPIQPLCLSVLKDDSRKQLESALDAITERLTNSNPEQLEQEAATLQQERIKLLQELRNTREKLLQARSDEYRKIIIAGEEYDPSQAARWVGNNKEKLSWIPGPVQLGIALPLSERELIELYRTNTAVSVEDEAELNTILPDFKKLLTPQEFEEIVNLYKALSQEDLCYGKEYWDTNRNTDVQELEALFQEVRTGVQILQKATEWQFSMIEAGMLGSEHIIPWQNLCAQIESTYGKSSQAKELILEFNPYIPEDSITEEMQTTIKEIIDHLKEGGSLNFFKLLTKAHWKTFINQVKINDKPPSIIDHFEALQKYHDLKISRKKLMERWERQVTVVQGPSLQELGFEPEYSCHQYLSHIQESINWHTKSWLTLIEKMEHLSFFWTAFYNQSEVQLGKHGELLRLRNAAAEDLIQIMSTQIRRLQLKQIETQLHELRIRLEKESSTSSHISQRLLEAIQTLEPLLYRQSFQRLVDIENRASDLKVRRELLAKLEKDAPAWASAITQRFEGHGAGLLPGDPGEAWQWRQLEDELADRSKKSMEELQGQIVELAKRLREKTAVLVDKKAWAKQVRRTTITQRQALNGWRLLMQRIGKGTGKRVPELMAEARRLMPACQSAVPVWIMPLSRVVENFNPRTNSFDVVIIDEASQADVLALSVLYMGKQVIVVGDNEQVSPSAVGQKQEETDKLIEENLKGIPNAKLYDGLFSIYDLASTVFQPLCLREHFRCVAPIIQFSNYLSYEGKKIKPLRDDSTSMVHPPTIAYRVKDAFSQRKVNEKEAEEIASLVVACTEQPEYQNATIGVISLVGEEQAVIIDRFLQDQLSAADYKRRRIQCGNAAQFQGDERDIIFLSLVDTAMEEGPLSKRAEGANDMYKKRYNVAASRARDQMWVVYSMDPERDLKPGDIRGELIKHAKDPQAILRLLDTAGKETESEFEKLVLFRLRQKGYTVHPQWKVGSYRLDMVVENKGKRIALECDGDKWHTPDNLAEDMSRQAILERLGWRFIRIRGSEFFRDPEMVMQYVYDKLAYFELFPENTQTDDEQNDVKENDNELKDRVIRRAAEIRSIWNGGEIDEREPESTNEAVQIAKPSETSDTYEYKPDSCLIELVTVEKTEPILGQQKEEDLALEEKLPIIEEKKIEAIEEVKPEIPQTVSTPFELISFLQQHNLEFIDNRHKGGTVWIIGNQDLSPLIEKLKTFEYLFRLKPEGGRTTKNRPAWYLLGGKS